VQRVNSPDIAVILPALDEAASIGGVLAELPAGVRRVVVDNGSRDGTAEVARAAGAEVVHEPRRGYGRAVQAGLRHLAGAPPEVVVILDADHADDPRRLPDLVGPIAEGRADLVLSDRSRLAEPGALTPAQRWGNRLALLGIRRATGHAYRDLGPFRALSWDALERLDLRDPTWGWNVEMQIKAARRGLRILEVSLPYRKRRAGRSKISGTLLGTVRAGYRIVLTLARHDAL
jgi:glycosyltransferase involved in cell wall biosynthesis